jgi:arylsulfatase A-like enzyme
MLSHRAIRKGRYKLVEHFEDGEVERYDLQADLAEANDLSEERPEKNARAAAPAPPAAPRGRRTDAGAQPRPCKRRMKALLRKKSV